MRAVYGVQLVWVCCAIVLIEQCETDIEVMTMKADKVDAVTVKAGCCAMTNTSRAAGTQIVHSAYLAQ